jgi:tRNA threonylcarbamoyladenosine biosynthesis protein TsaE
MKQVFTKSSEETRELARQFACSLKRGDCVALIGTLGAGKTQFTRGIADVFNCAEKLTSPTFTILNIYDGERSGERFSIHHFDWYRLNSHEELYNIGFEEYLYGDGISIIEWADKFPDLVPKTAKRIELHRSTEEERLVTFNQSFPLR